MVDKTHKYKKEVEFCYTQLVVEPTQMESPISNPAKGSTN
jgi:hypothetical protein